MFRTQAGDAASGQLDDSSPIGRPPPPTHPPPPWDLLAVGPRPPRWTPIEVLITCSHWSTSCFQEMSVKIFIWQQLSGLSNYPSWTNIWHFHNNFAPLSENTGAIDKKRGLDLCKATTSKIMVLDRWEKMDRWHFWKTGKRDQQCQFWLKMGERDQWYFS